MRVAEPLPGMGLLVLWKVRAPMCLCLWWPMFSLAIGKS